MPRPVSNPPNPWHSSHVEWLGEPPSAQLEVFEERCRSILADNDSPDLPFRYSLNPYRGCYHGCSYCYARPSHQYWDWGAGSDFERKLVVKVNAPELLRRRLATRSWRGDTITFSGNTDCYQPLEASYRLTRRCLEVCAEFRNPVTVVTKGALVRRDIDVLQDLARRASAVVFLSIPFADDAAGRRMEPYASTISKRFEALEALSSAGVPTGVAVAPVIPGLNDSDIPALLARARQAGARHAFQILLRLPREVQTVFVERLRRAFPERADKVLSALRQSRGGRISDSRFGHRMRGHGPRWSVIESMFESQRARLGFEDERALTPGEST